MPAKTGTTSIQSALAAHRGYLRSQGIVYPDGRVPYRDAAISHHLFAHSLTHASPTGWMEATAFVVAVEAALQKGERVLLSSEPVYRHQYGRPKDDFTIDGATFWDRRLRYLEALRRVLAAFDVEVLLYFRARDRLAESWYWDRTAEVGPQGPLPAFIAAFEPWFDYERHVATFRAVFPNVRIESYEDACDAPGGLLPHFFRTIECTPPPDLADRREHRSAYGGDAFETAEARAAFLARYPATVPR